MGQLVDTAGPQIRARVTQDSWSTLRAIGHGPESLWKAGPPHGISDLSTIRPGEMVEAAGHRTRGRVARASWSIPRSLGPKCESPGTAGQPHVSSNSGPRHAGQLVNTAGHKNRARYAGESWSNPWALGHRPEWPGIACRPPDHRTRARDIWDSWWTLRALGLNRELRERAGRNRVPSDTSASHPGQLVNPVLSQTWAESARDIWSNT